MLNTATPLKYTDNSPQQIIPYHSTSVDSLAGIQLPAILISLQFDFQFNPINTTHAACEMKKVLVIGAGVCGLTAAVHIAEFYHNQGVEVTLISEKFSPETTGDGSAGLWSPYLCKADKTVL